MPFINTNVLNIPTSIEMKKTEIKILCTNTNKLEQCIKHTNNMRQCQINNILKPIHTNVFFVFLNNVITFQSWLTILYLFSMRTFTASSIETCIACYYVKSCCIDINTIVSSSYLNNTGIPNLVPTWWQTC